MNWTDSDVAIIATYIVSRKGKPSWHDRDRCRVSGRERRRFDGFMRLAEAG